MFVLTQVSLPLTSPVTTITGFEMPGTVTGGAWSVRTTADEATHRPTASARSR